MDRPDTGSTGGDGGAWARPAQGLVAFLGLHQGAVPLVARGAFGREQRLALALALPSPWWWLACCGVVVAALAALALLDARPGTPEPVAAGPPAPGPGPGRGDAAGDGSPAPTGSGPPGGAGGDAGTGAEATAGHPGAEAPPEGPAKDRAAGYEALSAVVFLVGLYNGVAPFVSRLLFDGDLLLAVTLRLPSPWWWMASLAVLAATAAGLVAIDNAQQASRRD